MCEPGERAQPASNGRARLIPPGHAHLGHWPGQATLLARARPYPLIRLDRMAYTPTPCTAHNNTNNTARHARPSTSSTNDARRHGGRMWVGGSKECPSCRRHGSRQLRQVERVSGTLSLQTCPEGDVASVTAETNSGPRCRVLWCVPPLKVMLPQVACSHVSQNNLKPAPPSFGNLAPDGVSVNESTGTVICICICICTVTNVR